ncbi:MAG: hypothetical protein CUN55_13015 [Phototrophicales bacterium]|nr:MAG: hypothetical protein CUN55_13015 [Phototrophicales bacterium]
MSQYEVGTILPDLIVNDADNMPTSLKTQMGEKGLLIYVLRGTWCPFCVGQIDRVRRRYPKYQAQGVNTVFIVPEPYATVNGFAVSTPRPLPFQLYADEQSTLADALTYPVETPRERPIGIYLLNKERKIVWRFVGHEDENFPTQQDILDVIATYLP